MVEEINVSSWDHTAAMMAHLANIHRDPKRTQPKRLIDFHPFRKDTPKKSITRSELHQMRGSLPVHVVTLPKNERTTSQSHPEH
jgi:hypothetical protein